MFHHVYVYVWASVPEGSCPKKSNVSDCLAELKLRWLWVPLSWDWKVNASPLKSQYVFLMLESPFQPIFSILEIRTCLEKKILWIHVCTAMSCPEGSTSQLFSPSACPSILFPYPSARFPEPWRVWGTQSLMLSSFKGYESVLSTGHAIKHFYGQVWEQYKSMV